MQDSEPHPGLFVELLTLHKMIIKKNMVRIQFKIQCKIKEQTRDVLCLASWLYLWLYSIVGWDKSCPRCPCPALLNIEKTHTILIKRVYLQGLKFSELNPTQCIGMHSSCYENLSPVKSTCLCSSAVISSASSWGRGSVSRSLTSQQYIQEQRCCRMCLLESLPFCCK